jgi:glycosyltransferase involved in cell wall biosynthesis
MALPRSAVVASVDASGVLAFGPEVVAELVRGSALSLADAAAALARFDVAIIQHEFGIYGGEDGAEIVELVAALEVPVLLLLHTALRTPSPNQQRIVEELAEMAEVVVVQSEAARACLVEAHEVAAARVWVVPHGAFVNVSDRSVDADPDRRPVVLTWGLLAPGKGVEFAIEALACLRDLDPLPRYVVHGRTHPRVVEYEGEAYRASLHERARTLNVADLVEFDDRYVDTASVLAWIRESDIVLLPYCSRDQVVSGVLVEAIASGKPVIATRFPHAEELLAEGSGILVPYEDPEAIAAALRQLLTDAELRARMAFSARRQAPALAWETIGRTYRHLAAMAARASVGASR